MTRRPFQILAWLAIAAVVVVTITPLDMRPRDIFPVDVDRALACAVFAGLFVLAYPQHWKLIGLIMIAGAAAIEALQLLSPTRHARVEDAVVKAVGAMIGVSLAVVTNAAAARIATWSASARRARAKPAVAVADGMAVESYMRELPVQSKIIKAVYFSPEDGRLRIRFQGGEERLFENVPEEEAENLAAAPSPGEYYIENIRSRFPRAAA